MIWHHCPLHRVDPPQHNFEKAKKKARAGNKLMENKIQLKSSIRVAPLIEELSPPVAKRPTLTMQNQHVRGPLLEMQTRVRQKEATIKEMEAESMARKKRCDREERIAKVQIEAYWDLYPLPQSIEEARSTPAPDSEDDELIEDQNHEIKADLGTESFNKSEQELTDDDNLTDRCD